MYELSFFYTRDDTSNACGPLAVAVESQGFRGNCQTYVSETWLTSFARELQTFPLPERGFSDDLMIDHLDGLAVKVAPKGALGDLVLDISVRATSTGLAQRADVQLITDYATLSRFGSELILAATSGKGEARLVG